MLKAELCLLQEGRDVQTLTGLSHTVCSARELLHSTSTQPSTRWKGDQAEKTHPHPSSVPSSCTSTTWAQLKSSFGKSNRTVADKWLQCSPDVAVPWGPSTNLSPARTSSGVHYGAVSSFGLGLLFSPRAERENKAFCKTSLEEKYRPPPEPHQINK